MFAESGAWRCSLHHKRDARAAVSDARMRVRADPLHANMRGTTQYSCCPRDRSWVARGRGARGREHRMEPPSRSRIWAPAVCRVRVALPLAVALSLRYLMSSSLLLVRCARFFFITDDVHWSTMIHRTDGLELHRREGKDEGGQSLDERCRLARHTTW